MSAEIRLLQLSDPHLFARPDARLRGVNSFDSLQAVLTHALARKPSFDAVLCTGDIVNDDPGGYELFAQALGALGKPVFCVPGNHDDPQRMRSALAAAPFQVGGYADLGNWRLVLVDSCAPGQTGGHISAQELQALDSALSAQERYAMICVHHHPVGMSSRWLDQIGIDNAAAFFEVLDAHPQVRSICWGHVHQCFDARRRGVRLLATPSTCAQFLPQSGEFAIDSRPPAYRRTTLRADGTLDSEVIWLEQSEAALDNASNRSA